MNEITVKIQNTTPAITVRLDGRQGIAGAPGKSAYQIACEQDFTGTEAEWLDSLRQAADIDTETLALINHCLHHG